MNELLKAILKTLIYFDIFDHPLTELEIWKWLYLPDRQYSLWEVRQALNNLPNFLETRNGFYFLVHRSAVVAERLARYNLAEKKFKKALRFIKIFRFIPFIKMISVGNSLAYSNSAPSGDIDLFIIAAKNRLWLARFLAVGFLKLLKARPTVVSKQDTIDANFFLSVENLNIQNLQIVANDVYLTYWAKQIVPVFNPEGVYEKFQQANTWIKRILPNSYEYATAERRLVTLNWLVKMQRWIWLFLLDYDFLEQLAKKIQLKIMPADLKQLMNNGTGVVVNDDILKFHRMDKRAEYLNKFNEKLNFYGIN